MTRLRGVPNVVVPNMVACKRTMLAGPAAASLIEEAGFSFPLLVRVPGFHTGQYFHRVEDLAGLAAAAAQIPGDDVWLIEQLDAATRTVCIASFAS